MYLAYARHDLTASESRLVDSVRILVEHGADPNVGYLWHGLPSPFTALTGAFGEGELGPTLQPRHPHSLELARVLLEAGAEANDSQALYNRMFGDDDDHLVLLFEFGLGTGDGGPWRARLGDAIDLPEALLRAQLRWAVMHDQRCARPVAARARSRPRHDLPRRSQRGRGRRDERTPRDQRAADGERRHRRPPRPRRGVHRGGVRARPGGPRVRSRGRDPGEGGAARACSSGLRRGATATRWRRWSRSASTWMRRPAPTCRSSRSGRPRCTPRWRTATVSWSCSCSPGAQIPRSETPASTRRRSGWARHGGHTELIEVLGRVTPDDS